MRSGLREWSRGWRAGMRELMWLVGLGALLVLAACGGTTHTHALRSGSGPLPSGTPGGQPTATTAPYPTPVPPPYTFPKAWQAPASAPGQVPTYFGIAFAPSSPVGYACNTAQTAGKVSAPLFYATRDGGQSWQAVGQPPFAVAGGWCGVYVDAANAQDVFVEQNIGHAENPVTEPAIWRSQDGGATWKALAPVTVPNWPVTVQDIGVVGTHIVVQVNIQGEGSLDDSLYASDDGGATWHPFAASLPARVMGYVSLGSAVIVQTLLPVAGAPDRRPVAIGGLPRVAPGSSNGPPPVYYRSDDGGTTWNKISVPGGLPVFTLAASGNAYYGVSVAPPQVAGAPVIAYWSADSGATWKALPTLQGVENGWLDPLSLGLSLVVAPDGSVLTYTQHPLGQQGGESDAGLFVLNARSDAPTWQPLVPATQNQLAVVRTANGARVWTVRLASPNDGGGSPVYIELP